MSLWNLSPLIFAAGLALFYSSDRATRVGGVCLAVLALVIAVDPGDADNFWMAVLLGVVGVLAVVVVRPKWLRAETGRPQDGG